MQNFQKLKNKTLFVIYLSLRLKFVILFYKHCVLQSELGIVTLRLN